MTERLNFYIFANRLVKVERVMVRVLMDTLNGRPDKPYMNPLAGAPGTECFFLCTSYEEMVKVRRSDTRRYAKALSYGSGYIVRRNPQCVL